MTAGPDPARVLARWRSRLPAQPPQGLAGLVGLLREFEYRPCWEFELAGLGLEWSPAFSSPFSSLMITAWVEDTYRPGQWGKVAHLVPLPPSLVCGASVVADEFWRGWLFDQCLAVERHEAGEWFRLAGQRPFDPHS